MSGNLPQDLVLFDQHEPEFTEWLTPQERCRQGRPAQRAWNHFTSGDAAFSAGLWEAEPGAWAIEYTENEFCQILEGRSVLRNQQGREWQVGAGDNFVIPAGFTGEWEVVERTRKIYVIYQP